MTWFETQLRVEQTDNVWRTKREWLAKKRRAYIGNEDTAAERSLDAEITQECRTQAICLVSVVAARLTRAPAGSAGVVVRPSTNAAAAATTTTTGFSGKGGAAAATTATHREEVDASVLLHFSKERHRVLYRAAR